MSPARARALARTVLLAVGLLTAPAVEAGWLIVDESGDHTLLSRGRLKMAPKQTDGHSMVLDLTSARMWVADAGRRLYWEGSVEDYCQVVRGSMAAVEKQMVEQLKDMPPAQRAQVEQMLEQAGRGGAPGPPARVTVERTAETETIATLPTRKYRVLVNDKLYEELWLTSEATFVGDLELGRAPETFGRMLGCTAGIGGERVEATPEYRQLFAQGWPLKAVYHGQGGAAGRAVVTRVEQREIPERDFTPPAGFRQAPLQELVNRP